MTLRVAVIGASFARQAYLPALRLQDDLEVVAISSARLESAQAAADEFSIPNAYDDWEKMLAAHPVDLVCIATPTIYHAPMVLAALDAGAHVLCEKPMAMDTAEANVMLQRAEQLGRVHRIGHELRFNPNRRKIRQLIAAGELGQIRHINIWNISPSWGDPASRPKDDWWSLESMGGGRLGANGSHQIDLLRYWLGDVGGEFASVSGELHTLVADRKDKATGDPWTATADDTVHFSAELANGTIAEVFLSGVARHNLDNHTQIFGSEGTLLLSNGDERLCFARAGGTFEDISQDDPNASLPGVGKGIWNVSVVALMQELVDAIRTGRNDTEAATFADGARTQAIMDAVRQSSQERRWIDI